MAASGASRAMNSNPGYYKMLKENMDVYPHPCFRQIDLVILKISKLRKLGFKSHVIRRENWRNRHGRFIAFKKCFIHLW